MWFFKRRDDREQNKELANKEAEINAIKKKAFEKSITVNAELAVLNKLIEDSPDDIALRIFAATGGDKRIGK